MLNLRRPRIHVGIRPFMERRRVDFPHPLGPASITISPSRTRRLKFFTAYLLPSE